MKRIWTNSEDRLGLIILVVAMMLLAALLAANFLLRDDNRYDSASFCPLDLAYPLTAVLLDKSDPLTDSQSRFVRNYLRDLKNKLERFEKLSIYVLDEETFLAPRPVFSQCNPGTGKDANQLYENPERIRKRFDVRFDKPLEAAINAMMEKSQSNRSPIMEMIREVSFSENLSNRPASKRLIVISDMLQNMPDNSHYKGTLDYDQFAASKAARDVAANLGGAEVVVLYLWRPDARGSQGPHHIKFWESYFYDAKSTLAVWDFLR